MSNLFDHITRASVASSSATTVAHPGFDVVAEDERGVVYVLNVQGEIRSALSRDVVRYANDASGGSLDLEVVKHTPKYGRPFDAEQIAVSPSGRHACVSGTCDEGSGARTTAACYVSNLSAGSDYRGSGETVEHSCDAVSICKEEFDAVNSVRVVRVAWHPSADATLAMLTTDGVFRLINCDNVGAGGEPIVERCWKLDLDGSFPEAAPLRPDVVDFQFAPANGWGAFTVYFLAKSGNVHAMCPVVARGAKYPRVTLKHLSIENEEAATWLDETFPELGSTRLPMLAAHSKRDEGTPVALQGPIPMRAGTRGDHNGESEDALCLAISPFSGGGGTGNVVAILHASAMHVHIVPSELKPSWCDGPHKNMRGYTFVMSNATAKVSDLPSLITVDTIQLSTIPGEQSLAKVKFASVNWDPALRERVFLCVNGLVYSIVLTWLPVLEAAAEDMVDENHDAQGALPMPQVQAMCDCEAPFIGLYPLGDPLAEGVVISVRSDGTHRMLTPPLVSAVAESSSDFPSTSTVSVQPQTLEASSRSELRALSEGIRKDKLKSVSQIMSECGVDANMQLGDPQANEALAKCASALKEIYVDYARDVHDEVRTTALRMSAEIQRQKEEITALMKSVGDAVERHNNLVSRIEKATQKHEEIRQRLRDVAEREKAIPHPLTKAEKLLKAQMEAYNADLPLLRQRIEELNERAAVATEKDDDDIGYVGSRRVSANAQEPAISDEERKARKALAEQGEVIKSNVAKAKLVEEILEARQKSSK